MQFHISQLEICKNYLKILYNIRKINCSFNIALVIVMGKDWIRKVFEFKVVQEISTTCASNYFSFDK